MNLLNLPIDQLFVNILGIALCAFVVLCCICRLNVSHGGSWRVFLTQAMLIAFALWAIGTLVELARGSILTLHGAAAGLGILLYVILTFEEWRQPDTLGQHLDYRWDAERRNYVPMYKEDGDHHAGATHC